METALDPIAASAEAAERAKTAELFNPRELGREDFLRLLIAKLENQDPLAPSQDAEFISQLATFSSLEQLIGVNDNLAGLALGQATLINSQALSLIGKEALVESGQTVRIKSGQADRIVYSLPRAAKDATLTLYAPDGTPLKTFHLDTTPGARHVLDWDGTDSDGNPLPDGEYRIESSATDTEGEPMGVAVYRSLTIDGVSFVDGGIALISGDREIPFESIVEFRAGTEVAEAAAAPPPNPAEKTVNNVP